MDILSTIIHTTVTNDESQLPELPELSQSEIDRQLQSTNTSTQEHITSNYVELIILSSNISEAIQENEGDTLTENGLETAAR